jgi:hypothetical protein
MGSGPKGVSPEGAQVAESAALILAVFARLWLIPWIHLGKARTKTKTAAAAKKPATKRHTSLAQFGMGQTASAEPPRRFRREPVTARSQRRSPRGNTGRIAASGPRDGENGLLPGWPTKGTEPERLALDF